jgi:hypothetical protein
MSDEHEPKENARRDQMPPDPMAAVTPDELKAGVDKQLQELQDDQIAELQEQVAALTKAVAIHTNMLRLGESQPDYREELRADGMRTLHRMFGYPQD